MPPRASTAGADAFSPLPSTGLPVSLSRGLQASSASDSVAPSTTREVERFVTFIGVLQAEFRMRVSEEDRGRGPQASQDVEQFDLEHQGGVGANQRGTAALAVGELAGNPEAVLRPHRHQRQAFGPAGDDLVETELRRLVAGKRTVELGAIEQGAPVVHAYAVARLRAGAGPRTQH